MNNSIYISPQVEAVRSMYWTVGSAATVREQLALMSDTLYAAHRTGEPGAGIVIRNCHPAWLGKEMNFALGADFSPADARLTLARAHGFDAWGAVPEAPLEEGFERAVEALLAGDLEALKREITDRPQLLHQRSAYGHAATLLHYAGSNGVEIRRQVVPFALPEIVRFLIESGADPEAGASFYGGNYTPLEMAQSSVHPREAGIWKELQAAFTQN